MLSILLKKAISLPADQGVWVSGGNLATGRRLLGGCGSQSTGLSFGGYATLYVATTEEYDGMTWVATVNLATARRGVAGCGTQTAGLAFGGTPNGSTALSTTEEYDGTNWVTGGNMTVARSQLAGAGLQSGGLAFGGLTTTYVNTTEEYNNV